MVVFRTGRSHGIGLAVVSAMMLCAMAADSEEDGAGRQQITRWETPGNLAATNPLGCVAAETVSRRGYRGRHRVGRSDVPRRGGLRAYGGPAPGRQRVRLLRHAKGRRP